MRASSLALAATWSALTQRATHVHEALMKLTDLPRTWTAKVTKPGDETCGFEDARKYMP